VTDAQKIIQHMARLNIAGLPRNYELLHEAVHGQNAGLAADIAALGAHPHQAKLDELGVKYRLPGHCGLAADLSSNEAGKLLRDAAERLSEGLRQKHAFARTAETLLESLSGTGQSHDDFMSEMDYLATSLSSLISAETEIAAGLLAAIDRIETLERGVAAARAASVTDPLTGLPNRIAFSNAIGALYEREDGAAGTALVMVDIDDFRQLNVKYGQQAGNKLMKKLASLFQKSIKKNDFVSRIEGDAFAFLFANVGMQDAIAIAERLRVSVEQRMVFATTDKADPGKLTISVGVALSSDASTAAQLQANARVALLAAQSNRRQPIQAFGR
jgi:diguanylate cyclase (GGDEF)-like protein